MTTRIYVVKVKNPTEGPLFPFLYTLDNEAVVEMEEEGIYSIVTTRDLDVLLDQAPAVIEYDCGEFHWDGDWEAWCLSGSSTWGNGWESDYYKADSEQQALLDAVQYLIEFNREQQDFFDAIDYFIVNPDEG